jgi:hypothetical protein
MDDAYCQLGYYLAAIGDKIWRTVAVVVIFPCSIGSV